MAKDSSSSGISVVSQLTTFAINNDQGADMMIFSNTGFPSLFARLQSTFFVRSPHLLHLI